MPYTLITSEDELEVVNQLLDKSLPSYRKAYSDRTSWLMACCSELAYIKFNPLLPKEEQKDYFLEKVESLVGENKKSSLIKLMDLLSYDPEQEKQNLIKELQLLRLELLETYDYKGSQAILLCHESYLILAFRGTEPTSIRDIRADTDATTTPCPSGGKVHQGFKKAYEQISLDIQVRLQQEDCCHKPLFITGHSLGGALATIAAKRLNHESGIAACYTFGCPRVGDEEWVSGLKTPVYRVVNAADAVTMLPPKGTFVSVLGWVIQFVPQVGVIWRKALLSRFGGYLHGGNMRYLENVPSGEYDKVKLLYSVSLFFRLKGLFYNQLHWKSLLSDHSIAVYRKKLAEIAKQRNLSD